MYLIIMIILYYIIKDATLYEYLRDRQVLPVRRRRRHVKLRPVDNKGIINHWLNSWSSTTGRPHPRDCTFFSTFFIIIIFCIRTYYYYYTRHIYYIRIYILYTKTALR